MAPPSQEVPPTFERGEIAPTPAGAKSGDEKKGMGALLSKLLNRDLTTELLSAIANDDPEDMEEILESLDGASLQLASLGSPLHAAATYGADACIKCLLLRSDVDVNKKDKDGHTALHLAAVEGSQSSLELLLNAGADAWAQTEEFRAKLMGGGLRIDVTGGRTALHMAAAEGNIEAVRILLAADPNLANCRDDDGARPLDVAMWEGARLTSKESRKLSEKRRRLVEVFDPNFEPPSLEELRSSWQAAATRRKQRRDEAEKKRREKEAEAQWKLSSVHPISRGYQPQDLVLMNMDRTDLMRFLAPPLARALDLTSIGSEEGTASLRSLVTEVSPGILKLKLFEFTGVGDGEAAGRPSHLSPQYASTAGLGALLCKRPSSFEGLSKSTPKSKSTLSESELPTSGQSFGDKVMRELQWLEAWAQGTSQPLRRPNSMNRHGLVLQDVGLRGIVDLLTEHVLIPILDALWPDKEEVHELTKSGLPSRHGFSIRYSANKGQQRKDHKKTHIIDADRHLDTHIDSSDITLNLCLGGGFQGGRLYFHSRLGREGQHNEAAADDPMTSPHAQHHEGCSRCVWRHAHEPGVTLIHFGDHVHGADPLEAGERHNLVLWCKKAGPLDID
mmetsp:Transcript_30109/g.65062  ORF Transcript_30109/g.65062 Transcript_30109/m.65062 type:complete len:618 (+) Transcript_30109:78-1931(+)